MVEVIEVTAMAVINMTTKIETIQNGIQKRDLIKI